MAFVKDGQAEMRKEIVRQIGMGNLLSISGGRVVPIEHGIELPVSNGYHVRIELNGLDYYDVTRIFRRGGKEFVKGELTDVDCFQISEAAYFAGMFRSYDQAEWPRKAVS
jgi:hypothetical protein